MKALTHPNCPGTKAAVVDGEYITGCPVCLNITQGSAQYAAKYTRERMKENGRKDIVQRYDGDKVSKEWVKLYEDKARQDYGDTFVEGILRT